MTDPVKKPVSVTIVGPTHPFTGGIAQHTTRLALELESRGHQVTVESWKAQYPKSLYPGEHRIAHDEPEIGIPRHIVEKLRWYSPYSWWAAGLRIRRSDLCVVCIPSPLHALPYLAVRWTVRKESTLVGIVHNIFPHESMPGSRVLMSALLKRLDRVLVHYDSAYERAVSMGVSPPKLRVAKLPSPWKFKYTHRAHEYSPPLRLLFFGTVRRYKGLDLLLDALARTENVTLDIVGSFWQDKSIYDTQIAELQLGHRVQIREGYLHSADFEEVFGRADVLVLPYRSGSASIVGELAQRFGLPVIATNVGAVADAVVHGKTGLVIAPDDVTILASAIEKAKNPKILSRWAREVAKRMDINREEWDSYMTGLLSP